jgi:multidrug efflux pump subunit AcrB
MVTNILSGAALDRPETTDHSTPGSLAVRLGVSTEACPKPSGSRRSADVGPALAKFDADGRSIPIRVLLDEKARADRQVLEQIRVPSQRGVGVPLVALADISFGEGPVSIARYDRQRQARVEADLVAGAALSDATKAIQALSVMQHLPAGVTVTEGGDAELQAELFSGFGAAMRNGLLMVYVVLALLFASLLQPITILFRFLCRSPARSLRF